MAAITYSRQGDYLLPNLTIPEEEEVHLGKYAYLRNQYLMKNRYGMYLNLLTAGTLNQHLLQTEEEAQMRMETLIQQMAEKEGVTEKLKARDQMEWIGKIPKFGFSVKSKLLRNPNF